MAREELQKKKRRGGGPLPTVPMFVGRLITRLREFNWTSRSIFDLCRSCGVNRQDRTLRGWESRTKLPVVARQKLLKRGPKPALGNRETNLIIGHILYQGKYGQATTQMDVCDFVAEELKVDVSQSTISRTLRLQGFNTRTAK